MSLFSFVRWWPGNWEVGSWLSSWNKKQRNVISTWRIFVMYSVDSYALDRDPTYKHVVSYLYICIYIYLFYLIYVHIYIFTPFDCCKLNICIPTFSWQTKIKLGSGLPYFDQLWWWFSFSTTTPEVLMVGSPEIFSPFIKGDSELGRVSSIGFRKALFLPISFHQNQ